MKDITCFVCQKNKPFKGSTTITVAGTLREYCPDCVSQMPKEFRERRAIYDATGKMRDRFWLSNKLEMTRTQKKHHEDIMSRKLLPNGTIGRFNLKGERIG